MSDPDRASTVGYNPHGDTDPMLTGRRQSMFATSLAMGLLVASPHRFQQGVGRDAFARLPNVTLHYVDWGGTGPVLLFLTGLGDSAHAFDTLAPQFTNQARVLGLTRRGQGRSDAPESGYDPPTLAFDIRAFLDQMGIEKATLVGFSAAGSEMTYFAAAYPQRLDKLVYLDAANDYRSGFELATNPRSRYPLPLPDPPGTLGKIVRASRVADPDYTRISAQALAFFVTYETTYIPADADAELRARLLRRWEEYGKPFQQQRIAHFVRDMRKGEVIELHDAEHGDFLQTGRVQTRTVSEMRRFLFPSH
jgi:pimeloyl-ACP methyl ester carboxylesterase